MIDRDRVHVGVCIYCGSSENLTDEHAIPYALKGSLVLKDASCLSCNKITTRFERSILRKSMLQVRTALNLPTRRRKDRPKTLPLIFIRDDSRSEINVPIEDAIPAFVLPELGPPAALRDLRHAHGLKPGDFIPKIHLPTERTAQEHINRVLKKYSADAVETPWEINHDDFLRLIAKIGMCEAIFFYGFENFERIYVKDTVLGKDVPLQWVGSDGHYDIHLNGGFDDSSHVIATIRPMRKREVWVRVKLWNKSLTPEYIVIVGRLREGYANFLNWHGLIA